MEKSTVPVKAAESIINILKANQKPGVKYQVWKKYLLQATNNENWLFLIFYIFYNLPLLAVLNTSISSISYVA